MPPRLKLPDLKYDGTGEPAEHLETYKSWMDFRQLSESFVSQFAVNKVQRKPARHLYTIRQKDNESTEAFLNRFVKEEMSVKDCNDSTACGALMAGLRSATTSNLEASKLSRDFLLGGKHKIDSQAGPSKSEGNGNGNGKKNKAGNGNNRNPNNNNRNQAPQNNQVTRFREYTPTTVPVATIYSKNEHLGIFTIPPNIRTPVNRRDNMKYCHYHHDIGHVTEECRVLKDEIERLIQRGQLRNYVRGNSQQPHPQAQEN
ncbi:hypothetical protein UlMin_012475 [Ulmus minor]